MDVLHCAPSVHTSVETLGLRETAKLILGDKAKGMKFHEMRKRLMGVEVFDHEHKTWTEWVIDGETARKVRMHTCPDMGLNCHRETVGGLCKKPKHQVWTVEAVIQYHLGAFARLKKMRERRDAERHAEASEAHVEEIDAEVAESRLLTYIEQDYHQEEGLWLEAELAERHLTNQNDTMRESTYVPHIMWRVPGTDERIPVEKPRWFKGKREMARDWLNANGGNREDMDLNVYMDLKVAANEVARQAWTRICERMDALATEAHMKWDALQEHPELEDQPDFESDDRIFTVKVE